MQKAIWPVIFFVAIYGQAVALKLTPSLRQEWDFESIVDVQVLASKTPVVAIASELWRRQLNHRKANGVFADELALLSLENQKASRGNGQVKITFVPRKENPFFAIQNVSTGRSLIFDLKKRTYLSSAFGSERQDFGKEMVQIEQSQEKTKEVTPPGTPNRIPAKVTIEAFGEGETIKDSDAN